MKSSKKVFKPNGCGGKGGWIDPPDFIFKKDCNRHDIAYEKGGTEKDRLKADKRFLSDMLKSVAKVAWFRRPFLTSQAYLYYTAVRLSGGKFFKYKAS